VIFHFPFLWGIFELNLIMDVHLEGSQYSILTETSATSTQESLLTSTTFPKTLKEDENKAEGKLVPSVKIAWDAKNASKEPLT
jgi:hypothetical protein